MKTDGNNRHLFPEQWRITELPKICDPRGNLTFLENGSMPFDILRAEWIHGIPADSSTEGVAYATNRQIIIALSGAFDVELDNGLGVKGCVRLSSPWRALEVGPMVWRRLTAFATNSLVLLLNSGLADEADRLTDYQQFMSAAHEISIS